MRSIRIHEQQYSPIPGKAFDVFRFASTRRKLILERLTRKVWKFKHNLSAGCWLMDMYRNVGFGRTRCARYFLAATPCMYDIVQIRVISDQLVQNELGFDFSRIDEVPQGGQKGRLA
ncbi:hypothetical protein WL81_01985 [Burkholderia ubonensis]|nr:hypothetical protein WL81_01985 [Burkholderia ubonensis]